MAITKIAKQSRVDAFVEAAPDARPERTMRGHRRPLAMTLPPELIAEYDDIAVRETRSRARMIEVALREWATQYRAANGKSDNRPHAGPVEVVAQLSQKPAAEQRRASEVSAREGLRAHLAARQAAEGAAEE